MVTIIDGWGDAGAILTPAGEGGSEGCDNARESGSSAAKRRLRSAITLSRTGGGGGKECV